MSRNLSEDKLQKLFSPLLITCLFPVTLGNKIPIYNTGNTLRFKVLLGNLRKIQQRYF